MISEEVQSLCLHFMIFSYTHKDDFTTYDAMLNRRVNTWNKRKNAMNVDFELINLMRSITISNRARYQNKIVRIAYNENNRRSLNEDQKT